MRILLIGNFAPDRQESMQRFCELLRTGLADRGHDVQVLRPEPFFVRLLRGPSGTHKWLGYLDKYVTFPVALLRRVNRYDVVHICDHSNSMYMAFLRGKPNLVTCHDLIAVRSALGEIPGNPTGRTGRALQRAILRGLQRAQFVACVSEHTRRDVLRIARREESVTSCVHNGFNYPYAPMERAAARSRARLFLGDEARPFLLHVGGNQWYKNRLGMLEIYARLRSRQQFSEHRMIMVGKPFTESMRDLVAREKLNEDVVELTKLPNEDLRALYSLAEGFVFPSLEEGFGWPIAEAQVCGCPVFTSNQSPMTEIGGKAAVYFDPLDAIGAAEAIAGGLARRAELIEQSLDNAQRFGASAMLDSYARLYRTVCDNPSENHP